MRTPAALVVAVCACSGPAKPASPSAAPACRPAYAEYEARWSVALRHDLEELHFEGSVDEVVALETATLPRRDELLTLSATYKIVEAFIPDAAWPVAFGAAGTAIEQCGEGAPRPK